MKVFLQIKVLLIVISLLIILHSHAIAVGEVSVGTKIADFCEVPPSGLKMGEGAYYGTGAGIAYYYFTTRRCSSLPVIEHYRVVRGTPCLDAQNRQYYYFPDKLNDWFLWNPTQGSWSSIMYDPVCVNEEKCNDKIDNDGDGLIDEGCCIDRDGDSYFLFDSAKCLVGNDCNDDPLNAGAVSYPGAPERCGDGIDNNCNGKIDEVCGKSCNLDVSVSR